MELMLLALGVVVAALFLMRDDDRPEPIAIYIDRDLETPTGGLGCLPIALLAVVLAAVLMSMQ